MTGYVIRAGSCGCLPDVYEYVAEHDDLQSAMESLAGDFDEVNYVTADEMLEANGMSPDCEEEEFFNLLNM